MIPARLGASLLLLALAARAQDAPGIGGRLVGPDSRPVAGARVAVVPKPVPRISWESEPVHRLFVPAAADPLRLETTTASNGSWRVATTARLCDVVAWQPGLAPALVEDWRAASGPVAMTLGAGGRVRGVVCDLAETPVPGAVLIYRAVIGLFSHEIRAVADAAGKYEIAGLPDRPGLVDPLAASIEFTAPGFAPQVRPMHLARRRVPDQDPAIWELDCFLAKGATIEGKVKSHDGKPVAGAEVLVWMREALVTGGLDPRHRMHGYDQELFGVRVSSRTVTDGEGRYRLERVPVAAPGAILAEGRRIENQYPGGMLVVGPDGAFEFVEIQWFDQDGAKREEVDVVLPRSVTLRGTVTAEGKPCPGASVSASVEREGEDANAERRHSLEYSLKELLARYRATGSTKADAQGKFEVRGLVRPAAGGLIQVQIGMRDESVGIEDHVPIEDGATIVRDFVMRSRGYRLAPGRGGKVVDAAGKPVAGARVLVRSARYPNHDDISRQDEAVTDEGGEFVLPTTPTAGDEFVTVSARGHGTKSFSYDGARDGPIELALEPARRVTGRVATKDSKPLDRVRVFALDPAAPLDDARKKDILAGIPRRWIALAVTGPDGKFALDDVPAGELQLAAEIPVCRQDGTDYDRDPFVVAAAPAGVNEGVEIAMPAAFRWPRGDLRIDLELVDSRFPADLLVEGSIRREGARDPTAFRIGVMTGPHRLEFFDAPAGKYGLSGSAGSRGRFSASNVRIRDDALARTLGVVVEEE